MEQKVITPSPEPNRPSQAKHLLAVAALGLTTAACKVADVITSPDPVFSFARGAVGTVLLEAELGAGKLIDYGLNKTTNYPLGCLGMAVTAIPPLIVGALSIEYPAVGYAALAIPIFAAFVHLTRRE